MKKFSAGFVIALTLSIITPVFAAAETNKALPFKHAIAMHDAPKYAENFKHFDYVNPDAPKGGQVTVSALGTFDSLNPFILRGNPATGSGLMFDSLLVGSTDEPFTRYGLLAEGIRMPEDRTWVEFKLRPEATFQDGTPVTVADVIFTFNTLQEQGRPFYRSYYAGVRNVEKTGERTVKFNFHDGKNRELPLIIGEMPILSKNYYKTVPFNQTTLEAPLGSGPYLVADVRAGRSITYRLNENYWAKNLPVNRGRYNFERIRYEYYRDEIVAMEAFKANAYDFRQENIARNWANAYDFPAIRQGRVIKEEIPHSLPSGMQGFVFNIRRPLFSDIRVRQALGMAFDFEWSNQALFHDSYTRSTSYFSNSELASSGVPKGAEHDLLLQFKEQLPAVLFTQEFSLPRNDSPNALRNHLRQAQSLLREAGWTLQDGALKNANGETFTFEILLQSPAFERVTEPFINNLRRLGITATMRTIDDSQYRRRVDTRDFDIIVGVFGQSLSPGNEQRAYWHSSEAQEEGSNNIIGIENPVVDALVEKIIKAKSREELITATRALDRVLLWHHYVIPQWHLNSFRIAYWDKFGKPDVQPPYELGFIDRWWLKEKE